MSAKADHVLEDISELGHTASMIVPNVAKGLEELFTFSAVRHSVALTTNREGGYDEGLGKLV